MIPLITRAYVIDQLGGDCGRGAMLLSLPECPPEPLTLALALQTIADHIGTEKYKDIAQIAAGSARWLASRVMADATEATAEEISALHHPDLGIYVDEGDHRTIIVEPETMVLVLMHEGCDGCGILMAKDSHAFLMSPNCQAVVSAADPDDQWFASCCAVAPGTQVLAGLDGCAVDLLYHRHTHGTGCWVRGGDTDCGGPY
jgi:hypothetical protein